MQRLDDDLRPLGVGDGPTGASAIATLGDDVFVAGERSGDVVVLHMRALGFRDPREVVSIGVATSIRGLAVGPERVLYAVEEKDDRLLWASLDAGGPRGDARLCGGPFRLARAGAWLVAACLFDHAIVAVPVGEGGVPDVAHAARATIDGPFFGFDAQPDGDGLVIAAGGVEDHALDRTEGSFGFVDSFVYLLRATPGDAKISKLAAVNASEQGVVTPKAIVLTLDDGRARVVAVGAGSAEALDLTLDARTGAMASQRTFHAPLGVVAVAATTVTGSDGTRHMHLAGAEPLLDTWARFSVDGDAPGAVASVPDMGLPPRDPMSRLGQALFFTTLMAPWQRAEGRLSRFTCETCHFEGYVDGRTHATGRGAIRATTRPLLGLFGDRPYFSRALDPNLAAMVQSEFRVASANSGHDPWFSLTVKESQWLGVILGTAAGDGPIEVSPLELRAALMRFLVDFTPRENPISAPRSRFDDLERAGAAAFRDHCASCHEARTIADDARSVVPFGDWEKRVLSASGPVLWAAARYEKTGIEPYVHELGARVPALRRLYKKRPYFTNGSSPTLADVLSRAREGRGVFSHAGGAPTDMTPLSPEDQRAIVAFLGLL